MLEEWNDVVGGAQSCNKCQREDSQFHFCSVPSFRSFAIWFVLLVQLEF